MSRTLSAALKLWLNGTDYAPGHPVVKQEWRDELLLGDELQAVVNLDGTAVGEGSDLIGVYDSGSVFTATTLSGVLAELYTAATSASSDTFTDSIAYYAVDQVGPALVALGVAIGGASSTVRDYSSNGYVADNDSLVVAVGKLDAGVVAAQADADAAATSVGLLLSGFKVIPNGSTSSVQAVGAQYNGKAVLVSFAEAPTAAAKVWGIVAGGNLTVYCDVDNTADLDLWYLIDGR